MDFDSLHRLYLRARALLHALHIHTRGSLFQTCILLQILFNFGFFLVFSFGQLGLVFGFGLLEIGLLHQTVEFHIEIKRILAELIFLAGVHHILEELGTVEDKRRAIAHMHRAKCGEHVTLIKGVHQHFLRYHGNQQRVTGAQRHEDTHQVAGRRLVGRIVDIAVELVVESGFILLETFVFATCTQGENGGHCQPDQH